jgi:hypothetical protein
MWIKFWAAELFCDLFAAYTLGPAYGWKHFHLTATRKPGPFEVRIDKLMSHPPDQAQMDAILMAFDLIGFITEKSEIRQRWDELIETIGARPQNLYERACPKILLEMASTYALEAVKKIGCKIAQNNAQDQINNLLNSAWMQFWNSPSQYYVWERSQLSQIRKNLVPSA